MRTGPFTHVVSLECQFTALDLKALVECSQSHYDARCRSASFQGGVLYGMMNMITEAVDYGKYPGLSTLEIFQKVCEDDPDRTVSRSFTFRELDSLLKICETGGLFFELKRAQAQIREEDQRLRKDYLVLELKRFRGNPTARYASYLQEGLSRAMALAMTYQSLLDFGNLDKEERALAQTYREEADHLA